MPTWLIIYLSAISLGGMVVVARVWFWLERTTARRLERVSKKKRFEAIRTGTPLDNPAQLARDRAVHSIEAQFTVTKRLLLPLILVATAALLGLPFLGTIPASIVTVVLGALTVVGGVAARPLLENAFAGLVISLSRLVNIGDTVMVDGHYGTVEDITTTHTTIKIWDWRRYLVPNSKMLQSPVINYSLTDRFLWAQIEFYVSVKANLDVVRDLAIEAAKSSRYFAAHEDPKFWVMEMEAETVKCWLAAWANTPSDAWFLAHEARTNLATSLSERGIYTRIVFYQSLQDPEAPQTGEHLRPQPLQVK